MRAGLLVPVALLATACKPPPEAPTELNDLTRYLFRVWADDDVRQQTAGIVNLVDFLEGVDLTTEDEKTRSWEIADLVEEDVATLPARPDRPLEAVVGVSIGFTSCWPAVDHARMQIETDQLPAEPTAELYKRSFPEESDPACFPEQDCDTLYTFNDARRENAGFAADFELHKSFRWVPYETADGEPRDVFYSRSWFEQPWPGDKGKLLTVTLAQSYSVDVWVDQGDGTTWRYQVLWSETEGLGALGAEGIVRSTVRNSVDDAFLVQDQAIADLLHDGEACERPVPGDQ